MKETQEVLCYCANAIISIYCSPHSQHSILHLMTVYQELLQHWIWFPRLIYNLHISSTNERSENVIHTRSYQISFDTENSTSHIFFRKGYRPHTDNYVFLTHRYVLFRVLGGSFCRRGSFRSVCAGNIPFFLFSSRLKASGCPRDLNRFKCPLHHCYPRYRQTRRIQCQIGPPAAVTYAIVLPLYRPVHH